MGDYAFTIKFTEKTKKDCTPSDYDNILEAWKKRGIKIDTVKYESDSQGRCHAHGICRLPVKFYIKQLTQKGLHYKLDSITDRQGWINYINKHQQPVRMFKTIVYKPLAPTQGLNSERDGLEEEYNDDDSTPDGTAEVLKHIRRNIMRHP